MAIHINEIIFKATIHEKKEGQKGGNGGSKIDEKEKQMIIEESVEQVLNIINQKTER